jgi:multimeric flavodoxin WrbA
MPTYVGVPHRTSRLARMTDVRKGQAPGHLDRGEFSIRFRNGFRDPAFRAEDEALARLESIAWDAYQDKRKAPTTRKAGPGYADPDYDLSVDWLEARERIDRARVAWADPSSPSRILLICGSSRNDGTCPGEISKSFRLAGLVREEVEAAGMTPDLLDLSLLTSEYGRHIHPCKGCVATAMPLCHWPCSCYPNHALNQTNDWMNEIYERWTAAHGVVIVTPVYWYQSPCGLKLMIDRLVCADGGNPDPTSTGGKDPARAKELELRGWDYPKHLDRRAFGLVVHGDVAGIEGSRRALADWLGWMGLIDSGTDGSLDRYIGYYEPYATSHAALDADVAVQQEARNVGRAVTATVEALRGGKLTSQIRTLPVPRPK